MDNLCYAELNEKSLKSNLMLFALNKFDINNHHHNFNHFRTSLNQNISNQIKSLSLSLIKLVT